MVVVGVVTARGGSKGIPRKNVATIAGKPLIAWTIEAAQRSHLLTRLLVSTDDPEIAAVSRECRADVPFIRPAELARDASPHLGVIAHALDWLREREAVTPDYVLTLQPTSPLRSAEDIDGAIGLAAWRRPPAVVSVSEAASHPYLTMTLNADGALVPFIENRPAYARRQDLPPALSLNGAIFLNQPQALLGERTFVPAGTLPIRTPPDRDIDIDTMADWAEAEARLQAAFRI